MPTLRLHHDDDETAPVYRFPSESVRRSNTTTPAANDPGSLAMEALDSMDRRIDHLARELNCLVYFSENDDDRPRAA